MVSISTGLIYVYALHKPPELVWDVSNISITSGATCNFMYTIMFSGKSRNCVGFSMFFCLANKIHVFFGHWLVLTHRLENGPWDPPREHRWWQEPSGKVPEIKAAVGGTCRTILKTMFERKNMCQFMAQTVGTCIGSCCVPVLVSVFPIVLCHVGRSWEYWLAGSFLKTISHQHKNSRKLAGTFCQNLRTE